MHRTTLSFAYRTPDAANLVERSVRQEVGEIEGSRTSSTVVREGVTVEVRIEAEDLVALRAGLNTWLSLVSVAERVGDLA